MASETANRNKPYKLTPPLTRDSVITWDYNQRAYSRQNKLWRKYLPGGTSSTWTATKVDPTHGIKVMKTRTRQVDGVDVTEDTDQIDDEKTDDARSAFEDFLTCLAVNSPPAFFTTVMQESTSYTWVIDKINETFNLKTRGEHFLRGGEIKVDYGGDGATYGQGYMTYKDFYQSTLLKKNDVCNGETLDADEQITPIVQNFIIKEWLMSIDSRLPSHIVRTRGSLFTRDKPTLPCNLQVITEQIPTMLQELEAADSSASSISLNRINFSQYSSRGGGARGGGGGGGGGWGGGGGQYTAGQFRGRGGGYTRLPAQGLGQGLGMARPVRSCPQDTCFQCFGAGRTGLNTKNHQAKDCPWNQPVKPVYQRMLLLQPPQSVPGQLDGAGQWNIQELQVPPQDNSYSFQDQLYTPDDQQRFSEIDDPYFIAQNKDSTQYTSPTVSHIPTSKIQQFTFTHKGKQAVLSLDSGAEGDCMTLAECLRLGAILLPLDSTDVLPRQADGKTPLKCVGKAVIDFQRDDLTVTWHGYVVENLSKGILCGIPFLKRNDIIQQHNSRSMLVKGRTILEDSMFCPSPVLPFDISEVDLDSHDCQDDRQCIVAEVNITPVNFLDQIQFGEAVTKVQKERLQSIHNDHKAVFDGNLSEGYNGASGDFKVDFN